MPDPRTRDHLANDDERVDVLDESQELVARVV
jgi:hypothetical protein